MSIAVENRQKRSRSVPAAILTVLLLVPIGLLFVQNWRSITDDRDHARLERQGVAYLVRLLPLVSLLTDAQAAALQGRGGASPAMERALTDAADADRRLGGVLGTGDRWAGLRARIAALPGVTGGPPAVFQAHVEVADLLLALLREVRDNSGLSRDPADDLAHLHQAVAVELPEAVVQATRTASLSLLVANADARTRPLLGGQLGAALENADSSVGSLTDNLQAAVDDTRSKTLSSNLFGTLDNFRRGIETLVHGADPARPPNPTILAAVRSQLPPATDSLAGTILSEMDGLLAGRLDDIENRRRTALATAGAAGLLALLIILVSLIGSRRRGTGAGRPVSASTGIPQPGYEHSPHDPVPRYGHEVPPTQRERSGALR